MRLEATLKLGYYPLPVEHGPRIRARLMFSDGGQPPTVLDPCAGEGTALKAITAGSEAQLYAVELDANRASTCDHKGISTIHGNIFDVRSRVERFSLLYLNPPYDFETGTIQKSRRMEELFLAHTYSWLRPKGILVMVIPGKAISHILDALTTRFNDVRVYRMPGIESERYDQYAVFGVRHNNTSAEADRIRGMVTRGMSAYGPGVPDLTIEADHIYKVPVGGEVEIAYNGIPLDEVEDRLIESGAWSYVSASLLPKRDVTGGRPITPLHGGHVGLLATAGMINGVFGSEDQKHIARWRACKHTTVTCEEDEEGAEITKYRERFSNELALVFVCGTTMLLTENSPADASTEHENAPDASKSTSATSADDPEDESTAVEEGPRLRFLSPVDLDIDSFALLADGSPIPRQFEPGKIVISPGVLRLIVSSAVDVAALLNRHLNANTCAGSDICRAQCNGPEDEWRCESRHEVAEAPEGIICVVSEKFRQESPGTTMQLPTEM